MTQTIVVVEAEVQLLPRIGSSSEALRLMPMPMLKKSCSFSHLLGDVVHSELFLNPSGKFSHFIVFLHFKKAVVSEDDLTCIKSVLVFRFSELIDWHIVPVARFF